MMTNQRNTQQQQIQEGNPQARCGVTLPRPKQERRYQAYLLRCWAEPYAEAVTWRFSLEAIPSGKCTGFATLTDLLHFLSNQTELCKIHPIEREDSL